MGGKLSLKWQEEQTASAPAFGEGDCLQFLPSTHKLRLLILGGI